MNVRMESTGGFGRSAEVWVGGHLLRVCDYVSAPQQRCRPGVLEDVRFVYRSDESISWDQALKGNAARRKLLEPIRGWSYTGFGQVVSIMPVMIDFGVLTMEDPNWTTDESLIGRYVRIHVDRLEIAPGQPA